MSTEPNHEIVGHDPEALQSRIDALREKLGPVKPLPDVPGLAELMEERGRLRAELKERLFSAYYGIDPELTRMAAQAHAEFQDETDRLRCELTGEDPEELKREREDRSQKLREVFREYVDHANAAFAADLSKGPL